MDQLIKSQLLYQLSYRGNQLFLNNLRGCFLSLHPFVACHAPCNAKSNSNTALIGVT